MRFILPMWNPHTLTKTHIRTITTPYRNRVRLYFLMLSCNTRTQISEIKHIHKTVINGRRRGRAVVKPKSFQRNKMNGRKGTTKKCDCVSMCVCVCIFMAQVIKKGIWCVDLAQWWWNTMSISAHQIGCTWHLCLMEYNQETWAKKPKADRFTS